MQVAELPAGGDREEWRFQRSFSEGVKKRVPLSLAIPALGITKGSRE